MTVTVLGATGKTGSAVVQGLLGAGVAVRAVARSADKLAGLAKRGAKVVAADVGDPAALTAAFRGSDAVYAMIPGDYTKGDLLGQYQRAAAAIAHAVRESGVPRVAFLSSLGAERSSGTGPIVGLHHAEERLRAIEGLDLLLLRAGYFHENFFGSLELIKHQGVNGGAVKPDVAVTMIAAQDIGVAAAQALTKGDFSGVVVREMVGPRPLTMPEATRVLGRAIGKPELAYVQFPDAGFVEGLKGAGFSADAAALFLEMCQAFNNGLVSSQPGSQRVTTSTTFETFAESFAQAYRS
ncbi:MAG: NAD(P)H-binding protein [Myxococcales bacterium]